MDNQKVLFTYPEGFAEAANSFQFLPDEASRQQFLAVMVQSIIAM